jgi:hypothetical protein
VAIAILRCSEITVTMDIYSQVSSASTTEALRCLGGFPVRTVAVSSGVRARKRPAPPSGNGL